MKKFNFFTDPGHGWVAVKRSLLVKLGILNKITPYSYQRGNTVYLEEDDDASTFVDAYKAKYNVEPQFEGKYNETSPIRSYQSFQK